ncbi:hypothetical protein [Tateyamaria pelophila]|nr:hypothetical protein [Tateyamaria pelophila]
MLEALQSFRTSWARQGDDFNDSRITSVVALAPPPPVWAFTAAI